MPLAAVVAALGQGTLHGTLVEAQGSRLSARKQWLQHAPATGALEIDDGARAALRAARDKTDPLSLWLQGLCARRNKNVAAVALANKTMRLAWVLLRREEDYDPLHGHARPAQPA